MRVASFVVRSSVTNVVRLTLLTRKRAANNWKRRTWIPAARPRGVHPDPGSPTEGHPRHTYGSAGAARLKNHHPFRQLSVSSLFSFISVSSIVTTRLARYELTRALRLDSRVPPRTPFPGASEVRSYHETADVENAPAWALQQLLLFEIRANGDTGAVSVMVPPVAGSCALGAPSGASQATA